MRVMPALGPFPFHLPDCRDRANCMDGLIETLFSPRSRLEPLDTGVRGRWPQRRQRLQAGSAT